VAREWGSRRPRRTWVPNGALPTPGRPYSPGDEAAAWVAITPVVVRDVRCAACSTFGPCVRRRCQPVAPGLESRRRPRSVEHRGTGRWKRQRGRPPRDVCPASQTRTRVLSSRERAVVEPIVLCTACSTLGPSCRRRFQPVATGLEPIRGGYAAATRGLRGGYAGATRGLRGGYAAAMRRLCGGYAAATRGLRGGYARATRGLPEGYAAAARGLRGGCAGATRRLRRGYAGAARGLRGGYARAARGLRRDYAGAARGLRGGCAGTTRGLRGGCAGATRGLRGGYAAAARGLRGATRLLRGGCAAATRRLRGGYAAATQAPRKATRWLRGGCASPAQSYAMAAPGRRLRGVTRPRNAHATPARLKRPRKESAPARVGPFFFERGVYAACAELRG